MCADTPNSDNTHKTRRKQTSVRKRSSASESRPSVRNSKQFSKAKPADASTPKKQKSAAKPKKEKKTTRATKNSKGSVASRASVRASSRASSKEHTIHTAKSGGSGKPQAHHTAGTRRSTRSTSSTRTSTATPKRTSKRTTSGSIGKVELWTNSSTKSTPTGMRAASSSNRFQGADNSQKSGVMRILSAIGRGILRFLLFVGHYLARAFSAFGRLLRRSRIALVVTVVVALIVVIGAVDFGMNYGKAYSGVHVGDIDVSGMNEQDIESAIKSEYVGRLDEGKITIYASEDAQSAAEGEGKDESKDSSDDSSDASWTTTAKKLDAEIPVAKLAQNAVEVGREDGGIFARLSAQFQGWDIDPTITYDDKKLEKLAKKIDKKLGSERVDYDVKIEDGHASVTEGHDGNMVDRKKLKKELSSIFLSTGTGSFVTHVELAKIRIDADQAQTVCENVNNAIKQGVVLTMDDATSEYSAADVGEWIETDVKKHGDGYELVPSASDEKARSSILGFAKGQLDMSSLQVTFSVNGGEDDDTTDNISVGASGLDKVPSASDTAAALTEALFGSDGRAAQVKSADSGSDTDTEESDDADAEESQDEESSSDQSDDADKSASIDEPVSVAVSMVSMPSKISFEEARDMGVIEAFSTFTTEFSDASGTESRRNNIKLLVHYINNSVCKAGDTWSFNDTAGERTEDRGFEAAGSIVENEHVDEIGGGVCQVATTTFNAVYESGLPIVERHNHSLYMSMYPTGRDAAVNWPDLDLKWENDTKSDILVRASYEDTSVTVKLYGVSPNLSVETETGEWVPGDAWSTEYKDDDTMAAGSSYVESGGEDGKSITVTRTVTDEKGDVVRTDEFDSNYDPVNEVIVQGTQ